ncbi:hypothetical protein [Psychrobacillus sp. FSL K6-1415]|uniref:hypothetical protein n=1 Tax=Psychrobacillus sp. FSL K6-1415 TaxID=2921544 RepID=UPI0030F655CE
MTDEERLDKLTVAIFDNAHLEQENKKLRKALEFYADVENNRYFADYPDSYLTESEVMQDEGKIARKALEDSK